MFPTDFEYFASDRVTSQNYSLCTTDYAENTPNSMKFASYLSLTKVLFHTVTSSIAYSAL